MNFFRSAEQVSWKGATVRIGLMLTGEKLIDDLDYRDSLLKFESEAIGGEMEGAGVYVPCLKKKKDWIVIKAICDWADGNKKRNKDGRQKKAAKNAAEFVVHSLKQTKLITSSPVVSSGPLPTEKKTKLIIDFAKCDAALSIWLSEKLKLSGFDVWNRATAPILGDTFDELYKKLVKENASHVIALLSNTGLNSDEFKDRRVFANACEVSVVPVQVDEFDDRKIEKSLKDVERIDFKDGWGPGYGRLLKSLTENNVESSNGHDTSFWFFDERFVQPQPEKLASNQYAVTQLPSEFKKYKTKDALDQAQMNSLFQQWPATEFSDHVFISFLEPSASIKSEYGLVSAGQLSNEAGSFAAQKDHRNTVIELCKKTFYYHCKSKGLLYCSNYESVYFPDRHAKIKVKMLSGKTGSFNPTGERTFRKKDTFLYQMIPVVEVLWNSAGIWLLLRIRVRLTDKTGTPLKSRMVNSRRKLLCKNWWNDEWLKRAMGVMQFLSKDGETISIGGPSAQSMKINALPDCFEIPVSLDEMRLKLNKDEDRDELLTDEDTDEDSDWDDEEQSD